jgi:hypothetical protein
MSVQTKLERMLAAQDVVWCQRVLDHAITKGDLYGAWLDACDAQADLDRAHIRLAGAIDADVAD